MLAQRVEDVDSEEAFLAGLIHDMGSIILDHYFDEEFEQALRAAAAEQSPLLEAELKVFGMTHAEVGMLIAQKWNFPEEVTAAISVPITTSTAPSRPVVWLRSSTLRTSSANWRSSARRSPTAATIRPRPRLRATRMPRLPEDGGEAAVEAAENVRSRLTPDLLGAVGLELDQLDEVLADLEVEMEKSRAFLVSLDS